ncbi:hypothetical protein EV356DRAFT_70857 [Viridothelium virens]|uniref:Aminoglycoside phosphotransferase domain-containing protein n=1 Tax=Viridothelium virens TaxID=1048519 RepID=A0A6A6HEZ4_VIRVR|nr:hypothetical protein EV356DRAFT_70857 [Viridothelium virens]
MADVRKFGDQHILKSLKTIDNNTWLIGDLILRRLPEFFEFATWNDDDGSSFLLAVARKPLPVATKDVDSPHISLIHEAGDASAVWRIGNNVICKARYTLPGITPESTTLQYVQGKGPSFMTPEVLYHAFDHDRNYLFLRRIPGKTLFKIWPMLDGYWQQKDIGEIVRIIQEMAQWKGSLGGVDGQGILENWLLVPRAKRDYTPENLRANCADLGMDCSDCVFYHADLAPTNILVEDAPLTGRVGIVDFELAGFFPKSWIRTKFRASWAFDLDESTNAIPELFRTQMEKALEAHGYDDLTEAWRQRRKVANNS